MDTKKVTHELSALKSGLLYALMWRLVFWLIFGGRKSAQPESEVSKVGA